MTESSIKSVQEAKSGVLCFGKSTHLSNYITIKDETIVHIAGGCQQTAVVCESGHVYTMEDNRYQEQGSKNVCYSVKQPNPVTTLKSVNIVRVACGNYFTCFVSAEGELYTCGLNNFGQLGLGNDIDSATPVKVKDIPKIKKVATGAGHLVALSMDGEVWVAGYNAQGQLGLDHCTNQSSLTRITSIDTTIADVSCGSYHTALLSADGVLYVTGSNSCGALGLGDISDVSTVQAVTLPSAVAVAAVACGSNHMVALTVEGTVWAWGQNYYGQIGVGKQVERCFVPQPMAGLDNYFVVKVLAGADHTALITDEGNILVCGSGGEGQLRNKGKKDIYEPTPFPLVLPTELYVKDVVCAYNTTLVLLGGPEKSATEVPSEEVATVQEHHATEHAAAKITDWEKSVMTTLQCHACFKVMCAPIHHCVNDHNICDACCDRSLSQECLLCSHPLTGLRNDALESLGRAIQLPCSSCLARVPVPLLDSHLLECPKRNFKCPLVRSCSWSGRPEALSAHATSKHTIDIRRTFPFEFSHSLADDVVTDVLAAHGRMFVLYRKFDHIVDGFRAAVRFFGALQKNEMYEFNLEVSSKARGDSRPIHIMFARNVCVNCDDVGAMLYSDSAILLERKNFGVFFKNNEISCVTNILRCKNGVKPNNGIINNISCFEH